MKHTIEMSLIEIINEFTYTGYRVEAMTRKHGGPCAFQPETLDSGRSSDSRAKWDIRCYIGREE